MKQEIKEGFKINTEQGKLVGFDNLIKNSPKPSNKHKFELIKDLFKLVFQMDNSIDIIIDYEGFEDILTIYYNKDNDDETWEPIIRIDGLRTTYDYDIKELLDAKNKLLKLAKTENIKLYKKERKYNKKKD